MTQVSFHQLLVRAYAAATYDLGVWTELSYVCPAGWTYGYSDGRYHVHGLYLQHPEASFFGLLNFISYNNFTAWRLLDQEGEHYHFEIVTSSSDAVCAFVLVLTLSPTLDVEQTFESGRIRRNAASAGTGAFAWGGALTPANSRRGEALTGASAVDPSETATRILRSPLQGSGSFSEWLARVVLPTPHPVETLLNAESTRDVRRAAVKSVDAMLAETLPAGWAYEFIEGRYVVKGLFIQNPYTTFCYFISRVAPQEFCMWRSQGPPDGPVIFEISGYSADGLCPIVIELTLTRAANSFGGLCDLAPRFRRVRFNSLVARRRNTRRY